MLSCVRSCRNVVCSLQLPMTLWLSSGLMTCKVMLDIVEMLVRTRVHKGFGPLRLEYELKQQGLALDLIQQHIAAVNWCAVLYSCWHKKSLRYQATRLTSIPPAKTFFIAAWF